MSMKAKLGGEHIPRMQCPCCGKEKLVLRIFIRRNPIACLSCKAQFSDFDALKHQHTEAA
jgi:transcription elongation factor Elf1